MTTADCVIVDDEPGFDFDGDDRMDLALVAPKYDEGATDDVGRVYIFYGQISGDLDGAAALGSADGPDVIISGDDADDRLSKVTAGDFNGDGLDDLAVSSPYVAGGAPAGSGMVFIYFGNTPDGSGNKQIGQANASDTHVALDTGSSADVVIRHEDFAGQLGLGSDIVCPGDINGDGYEDLVIADERYDSDTMADPPNIGRVYIFYGGPDFVGSKIASDADVTIIGDTTDNTYFGISVGRAGDVNGDGLADVLAGAWLYDGAAYIPPPTSTDDIYYGAGYLFYGDRDLPGSMGVNGTLGDDDQPAVRIVGPNTADLLGRHVTGVGDVNNDGFDDFSVSSYWAPYSGTSQLWDFTGIIYLFYGSATLGSTNPTPGLYDDLAGATPASVTFESDAFINTSTNVVGEGMGYAVSKIGDYDGDDIDDLAISAVGWSRADAPPTNTEVSAPSGSSNVPPGRGRVYIIKGGTTNFPATVANYGTSNVSNTTSVQTVSYVILEGDDDAVTAANGREEMGKFISGVGDLDGDGTMDIAISSTFTALDSSTDESTGQVYLLLGNSAQPSPVDLNVAHTQFSSYVWTVAAARVGQGTGTDPEEYETGDLFGNCIAK
ncbi:MAG: integrin alpha [Planctomycetes bacterium]|nr:integrin alpha [Planctomycetota bacterium]